MQVLSGEAGRQGGADHGLLLPFLGRQRDPLQVSRGGQRGLQALHSGHGVDTGDRVQALSITCYIISPLN